METVKKLLSESGLSKKEIEIYLSVLELGQATILQIADKSKIKRPTIYDLVPLLINKGFVTELQKGKKTFYQAQNPNIALAILKKRTSIFEASMPELMAIFNSPENKPKVQYYQGPAEIQRMYEDTLKEGLPISNLTSISGLFQHLDKDWVKKYIKARIEKNITTKIIAVDSKEARVWEETAEKELREIKLIQKENCNFSADMHIYGNKIIIATYQDDLFGLIIEDANIASLQRMSFELLWSLIK
jgi:sugar-specific transcriptional regulator TrmB